MDRYFRLALSSVLKKESPYPAHAPSLDAEFLLTGLIIYVGKKFLSALMSLKTNLKASIFFEVQIDGGQFASDFM